MRTRSAPKRVAEKVKRSMNPRVSTWEVIKQPSNKIQRRQLITASALPRQRARYSPVWATISPKRAAICMAATRPAWAPTLRARTPSIQMANTRQTARTQASRCENRSSGRSSTATGEERQDKGIINETPRSTITSRAARFPVT